MRVKKRLVSIINIVHLREENDRTSTYLFTVQIHSFCSVPSHLLKSVERHILHIWEQREAFTPSYLGTGGVSPYGGNRGSLKYEHVNGRE